MSPLAEHSFTAYVGIDWADTKHDICLQASGNTRRESCCIRHQVAAIDEWANTVHRRFGGPVAVAIELAKGPIVAALQKYEFFVLFPINPATLAKYREAFHPSGAKDDPGDAELALDLLLHHPERFGPLKPQSVQMRTLVSLVERRRQLVGDQTRLTNRLCDTLKQYYPQALEWFHDRGTMLFCDFLDRWPTLRSVKQARTTTLEAFFHTHHCRSAKQISARIGAIRAAAALTEDPAIIGPCRLHVLALVAQLRAVLAAIGQFEHEIAAWAATIILAGR
ncbi:IS110 family transposase [Paraburkholderia franconis]|nr:transposase [Paraburkholderia franconis]